MDCARRRRQRVARTGLDELLASLDEHRDAVGLGRRTAASARPTSRTPREKFRPSANRMAIAMLDADGWRDRIAGLVAADGLCRTLGITFRSGGPGRAEVAMTVDARHLNFNGGGHGGAIFALADSAFGLASNSHGPVASGITAHITFQAAVAAGDTLLARASEVQRSRRIGVYRIDVVREEGDGEETAVSSFTGTVYVKD
jgi:acyl-CoA thioesterase